MVTIIGWPKWSWKIAEELGIRHIPGHWVFAGGTSDNI